MLSNNKIAFKERFEGCILGGVIGDAWGSGYENIIQEKEDVYYLFGKPEKTTPVWSITDDTQLTLATIEAIVDSNLDVLDAELLAKKFLEYYKHRNLSGLGASTLKSLRDLEFGMHWSQAGRQGEYAAANGAAMRIAAVAFNPKISKRDIHDYCRITHNNDEAYVGALCVVIAIRKVLNGDWNGHNNLIEIIIDEIPDTKVRDRLSEIMDIKELSLVGQKGNNGYVVNSVPLAIAAANKVFEIGLEEMYLQLIDIGGDTDTNCSIAGQIAGTLIGVQNIPTHLIDKLKELNEFNWIQNTIRMFIAKMA